MQRLVRDLMRIRQGLVVSETTLLRDVAERLIISDCDIVAVVDPNGRLSGIVCESSVVRALMANPSEEATIHSITMRHAESVRADAALTTVLPLFRSSGNTAIPVVDQEGCVLGLLVRRDVITSLLHRRVDGAESVSSVVSHESTAISAETSTGHEPLSLKLVSGYAKEHSGNTPIEPGQPRPHFLRADAARRFLFASEDRL